MSKHTDGNWIAEMYPSGGFEIGVDGAGFTGGYFVVASRQSHPRVEEMHANARLIAAAPDLLDALKDLVGCPFEIDMASVPRNGIEIAPSQVVGNMSVALMRIRKAKAAIDKAVRSAA